jgi:hypothetical protein
MCSFKRDNKNEWSSSSWMDEMQHQHDVVTIVALQLHKSCYCEVVMELHTYIIAHMMSYVCCNSCNSFNITHGIKAH